MPQPNLSLYPDSPERWRQVDYKDVYVWLRATWCRWLWYSDVEAFFSATCYFDSFELYSIYKYYLLTHLIRELLIGRVCVLFTSVP